MKNSAPTPRYLMHKLGVGEETQYETHVRLMKEWYGLKPARRPRRGVKCLAYACPAWVMDQSCRADGNNCDCPDTPCRYDIPGFRFRHKPLCLCQQVRMRFDHTNVWHDEDGGKVWTTEPYDDVLDIADFTELKEVLARNGLTVRVTPRSPWFPSWTTLIMIKKKDAAVGTP